MKKQLDEALQEVCITKLELLFIVTPQIQSTRRRI